MPGITNGPFQLQCACFKTRLRDKFDLHENTPLGETHFHEWFRMKTRYDTEAKGNSTDCLAKL